LCATSSSLRRFQHLLEIKIPFQHPHSLLFLLLQESDQAERGSASAAVERNAIESLLAALKLISPSDEDESACEILHALSRLCSSERSAQDRLYNAHGMSFIVTELYPTWKSGCRTESAILKTMHSACKGHEPNKVAVMDSGGHKAVQDSINRYKRYPSKTLKAACAFTRTLVTADDCTHAVSATFQHGRAMYDMEPSLQSSLLSALTTLTESCNKETSEHVASVASTLKACAVNDEVCNGLAEQGAAQAMLDTLHRWRDSSTVMRSSLGLLKQLACSDVNKAKILNSALTFLWRSLKQWYCIYRCISVKMYFVAGDGLPLIVSAMHAHADSQAVLEQALGLLAALTLRKPNAARESVESGCHLVVLHCMQVHKGSPSVLRQACMYIRNAVSRCPELQRALLDNNAEELIRETISKFSECSDVGVAALRDLGLINYNEAESNTHSDSKVAH